MQIKTFTVNPLSVNCYVAYDDTAEGVIIDCGCQAESEWAEVKSFITDHHLTIRHILNTHLHFDHIWGVHFATRDYSLRPEASPMDAGLYMRMDEQIHSFLGFRIPVTTPPPLGRSLNEGDVVTFGETTLEILHTPGHTPGCVCFYSKDDAVLFSGDTLFMGSYGRTDFEGGDAESMSASLRRLAQLPDTVCVYPGHGPATAIGHEKRINPGMCGLS